jgi:ribose 5-phosphate isomerase A
MEGAEMDEDRAKRAAGVAAAGLVAEGMRLGLGSGSTVAHFLTALAERDLDVVGVPTSEQTAASCRELGIALVTPDEVDRLDLCVDGADELDRELTLVKGGGGAHLREKVVASMADRFVVVATSDKQVERLADSFPLPVEVVPFALGPVRRELERRGFEVARRPAPDGHGAYRTDNGNAILDARFPGGLADPAATEVALTLLPGVVEVGLFVDLADTALLADADGTVTERHRPASD